MESRSMYTTTNGNGAKVVMKSPKLKIYTELIRHLIGACAAVYELATGEKPPKIGDVLRG